ncbi:MAG: hypothetical protein ACM3VS_05630 [Candidatus Dadabacteria bacterium]
MLVNPKRNEMKQVVLYFPDGVNLKAFVLIEQVREPKVNQEQSLLLALLNQSQIENAVKKFGAIIRE